MVTFTTDNTKLKDAWQWNTGLAKISTTRVVYTN